jgi:hypothetical protein
MAVILAFGKLYQQPLILAFEGTLGLFTDSDAVHQPALCIFKSGLLSFQPVHIQRFHAWRWCWRPLICQRLGPA